MAFLAVAGSQFKDWFADYCLYNVVGFLIQPGLYRNCCCCYLVTKQCLTLLWPHGLYLARLLCPWDSPGKRILAWTAITSSRGSSQPRDPTQVSYIAVRFLTTEPRGKNGALWLLPFPPRQRIPLSWAGEKCILKNWTISPFLEMHCIHLKHFKFFTNSMIINSLAWQICFHK